VSVETISRLFTGSNRLRLAPSPSPRCPSGLRRPGQPEVESVAVAEAVLRDSYAASTAGTSEFADVLADRHDVIDRPPPHAEVLHEVLRKAFEDVRDQQRSDRVQTTQQMLWADELLENQSEMQSDLQASADLFVRGKRRGLADLAEAQPNLSLVRRAGVPWARVRVGRSGARFAARQGGYSRRFGAARGTQKGN
jgi:hypothetical protein